MKKGFTLIELLVVIAIIGILSSVVLVSLNSARNKGKDTRVISSVQQLRTQLESDYTTNYNAGFTGNAAACTVATDATCALVSTAGTNYATLSSDITSNGGTLTVMSTRAAGPVVTAYALYGRLVSDTTKYFCIDSTGKTNQAATAATTVVCP